MIQVTRYVYPNQIEMLEPTTAGRYLVMVRLWNNGPRIACHAAAEELAPYIRVAPEVPGCSNGIEHNTARKKKRTKAS